MRFLRVLRLGLILARLIGNIAPVVAVGDRPPRGADRAAVHLNAVGTHVGDRAVLVEILRNPHRVAGRETELARGFLLQGRGREGRRRIARQRLGFDAVDGEMPRLHIGFGGARIGLVGDRQTLDLVAAPAREPRLERRAAHFELAGDRPILLRNKGFDFAFAFDDEAQRHRLDATRRFGAGQLAPQNRREGEADEIVERAPRPVCVDQIVVEAAGTRHRIGHRLLGNRVEGHAIDLLRQRLFLAQQFLHVPADRLALAIGVGRENQTVGLLRGILNILQPLRLVRIELPLHRKTVIRIDRAVLGRQVADVAIAGQHLEITAEIFLDRLRLGGRFHNHQLHRKFVSPKTLTYVRARVAGAAPLRQEGK